MRLFLAINPPADVSRRIWDATATVREAAPNLAWVAEAKIHITLKFLGEVLPPAAESLVETAARIGASHAAPVAQIEQIGAFPNLHRPRIVWVGVNPGPRLELLHHDIEVACAALGFEVDGRPFRPHLTLARVPTTLAGEQLRRLRSAVRKVRFSDEFSVTSIDLMRSDPGPTGSVYTTLATAPLRGA